MYSLEWVENGVVTQSRYATPEIYVLFFSALATCSWTLMNKHTQERYVQHRLTAARLLKWFGIVMASSVLKQASGKS